jgi:hypothetical protein
MIPRPPWADPAIVIGIALVMVWVAYDMVSTSGVIPGLMYPAFFGTVPLFFVFGLRLPLEAFLLFLIWMLGVVGLGSGLMDGVTSFPSKNGDLTISSADSPIVFALAMTVNAAVVGAGVYFAFRWWKGRDAG